METAIMKKEYESDKGQFAFNTDADQKFLCTNGSCIHVNIIHNTLIILQKLSNHRLRLKMIVLSQKST